MPHLAPINWIMTLSLFWLTLIIIASIFWWSQTPNVSISYLPTGTTFPSWKWGN